MNNFIPYTTNNAPMDSVGKLLELEHNIGFIPNIFATVAGSPTALSTLMSLNTAFAESSFTPYEQQVILLATSTQNQCVYCVAGHTTFAQKQHMPTDIVDSLRNFATLSDERLDSLSETVRRLIMSKGKITPDTLDRFLQAGYAKGQFFELVIGICLKTFTNYVSNALSIPLDEAFQGGAWERPSTQLRNI